MEPKCRATITYVRGACTIFLPPSPRILIGTYCMLLFLCTCLIMYLLHVVVSCFTECMNKWHSRCKTFNLRRVVMSVEVVGYVTRTAVNTFPLHPVYGCWVVTPKMAEVRNGCRRVKPKLPELSNGCQMSNWRYMFRCSTYFLTNHSDSTSNVIKCRRVGRQLLDFRMNTSLKRS